MEKSALINSSKTYHYQVATGPFFDKLLQYQSKMPMQPGVLVVVPLGGKQSLGAIISSEVGKRGESHQGKIKEIIEAHQDQPFFDDNDLQILHWACTYYVGTFDQVLQCMAGLQVSKKRDALASLTSAGTKTLAAGDSLFQEEQTTVHRTKLTSLGFFENQLAPVPLKASKLKEAKELEAADLLRIKRKSRLEFKENKKRPPAKLPKELPQTTRQTFLLSDAQSEVFGNISGSDIDTFKVDLLHGITGSGKTEVYLKYMEKILSQPRASQVLLLIPEISLSPQTAARIERVFPGRVAITHSQMTEKKRFEAFEAIRTGAKDILVGPRSNVFASFANLGLIIVDEEHDTSYKQNTGLCYHARDVAVKRAHLLGIPILLGSATPSIETMQNCNKKKYRYHALLSRHRDTPLPTVEVVRSIPTFKVFKRVSDGPSVEAHPISKQTLESIQAVVADGKQVMVVQGRRGVSNYIYNKKKSSVLSCDNCSVSYTLHAGNKLMCHYCGKTSSVGQFSARESHDDFFAIGAGTQSLESYLAKNLPDARIGRLDSDATAKKGTLEKVLEQFRTGKLDILVGTQMLAKGHDFPGIDLVVMVDLDQSLLFPDYRASEFATQTLVQAAGRSGRGGKQGKVVVESSQPDHSIFSFIQNHDYKGFCEQELENRELLGYPPFSRATLIEVQTERHMTGPEKTKLVTSIENALKVETASSVRLFGPSQPMISKLNNRHRQQVLLLSMLSDRRRWLEYLRTSIQVPSAARLKIIVDPYGLI